MSFDNFKPRLWAKEIQHDLERKCILVPDCITKFEGQAKQGESVKILGVGKVTIGDYDGKEINPPETPSDTSVFVKIDQAKYFNFGVDDVDKAQSVPGLMEAYLKEAKHGMQVERDKHVGKIAAIGAGRITTATINTSAAARKAVDDAIDWLRTNDIAIDDEIILTISPYFYRLLRDFLVESKTSNDGLLKNGVIGSYDGATVKLSNNLYTGDNGHTHMLLRTKEAVAFAGGIDKVEAYRPEKKFSDAIKGLDTHGAKVVRPKELVAIGAKK